MFGSRHRRSGLSVVGSAGPVAAGSASAANPIRALSIDQLARKYDFTPPDEYVGTDSGRLFLDYGPPVVLADSSQRSSGEEDEQKVWQDTLFAVD